MRRIITEAELNAAGITIRERHRRGRPPEAFGAHVEWWEYQVVDGRKIVSRWDTRDQAFRAACDLLAPPASPLHTPEP